MADDDDRMLVEQFLELVRGMNAPQIEREAQYRITKNDVSRWRQGKFTRLSESKREALRWLLGEAQLATHSDLLRQLARPVLTISQAVEEIAKILSDAAGVKLPAGDAKTRASIQARRAIRETPRVPYGKPKGA